MATAEGNYSIGHLLALGLRKGNIVFLGDGGGNGGRANCYAAGKKPRPLDINKIGGLGSDVHEEDGGVLFRIIVTEGVVEGHGRSINLSGPNPRLRHRSVDLGQGVTLDRNEGHFLFRTRRVQHGPVPDHLLDGKGDVLLGLKLDQFVNIILLERRQLHEAGKDRLSGHGVADLFLLHLQGSGQLLDGQGDLRETHHLLRGIRKNALRTVGLEDQST